AAVLAGGRRSISRAVDGADEIGARVRRDGRELDHALFAVLRPDVQRCARVDVQCALGPEDGHSEVGSRADYPARLQRSRRAGGESHEDVGRVLDGAVAVQYRGDLDDLVPHDVAREVDRVDAEVDQRATARQRRVVEPGRAGRPVVGARVAEGHAGPDQIAYRAARA